MLARHLSRTRLSATKWLAVTGKESPSRVRPPDGAEEEGLEKRDCSPDPPQPAVLPRECDGRGGRWRRYASLACRWEREKKNRTGILAKI